MAPPGGIPTLSGFCAVICAGRNIVLGVDIDPSALFRLRHKSLSSKVIFLLSLYPIPLWPCHIRALPESALLTPTLGQCPPPRRDSGPT